MKTLAKIAIIIGSLFAIAVLMNMFNVGKMLEVESTEPAINDTSGYITVPGASYTRPAPQEEPTPPMEKPTPPALVTCSPSEPCK